MDQDRLQPALYGGLVIGVLSGLPIVSMGNCCCCLWVLAGGALAVYLRQQNSPTALPASEGALLGLMAGFIGGVVAALISIPLAAMTAGFQQQLLERVMSSNADMPPQAREMMQRFGSGSGSASAMQAAGAIMGIVVDTVFGMIGGLLGVAMFKKDGPPPPGTVEVLPRDN